MAGHRQSLLLLLFQYLLIQRTYTAESTLKMSMSMKDLGPDMIHPCSKTAFNKCEATFQLHVEAVTEHKSGSASDKQDLWCQVLTSHSACMGKVLKECMADYPILSGKIETYLKQVVHKGCTHKGNPIDKTCITKIRSKRSVADEGKTLYDLANACMKNNGKLDPTLQSLMDLLHNLNRSRQHLYKRLPEK